MLRVNQILKALIQLKKHLESVLLNREPEDAHSSLGVFWGLCATWLYVLIELSIKKIVVYKFPIQVLC